MIIDAIKFYDFLLGLMPECVRTVLLRPNPNFEASTIVDARSVRSDFHEARELQNHMDDLTEEMQDFVRRYNAVRLQEPIHEIPELAKWYDLSLKPRSERVFYGLTDPIISSCIGEYVPASMPREYDSIRKKVRYAVPHDIRVDGYIYAPMVRTLYSNLLSVPCSHSISFTPRLHPHKGIMALNDTGNPNITWKQVVTCYRVFIAEMKKINKFGVERVCIETRNLMAKLAVDYVALNPDVYQDQNFPQLDDQTQKDVTAIILKLFRMDHYGDLMNFYTNKVMSLKLNVLTKCEPICISNTPEMLNKIRRVVKTQKLDGTIKVPQDIVVHRPFAAIYNVYAEMRGAKNIPPVGKSTWQHIGAFVPL